jgi:hypothetical protein
MTTSLKSEAGRPKPNAPHILRDASPAGVAAWRPDADRVLIRIPDLGDTLHQPPDSRKVQRLIDVLRLLRNRPRSLAASGIVLAGAILATVLTALRQPETTQQLTTAPAFESTIQGPRRLGAGQQQSPTPPIETTINLPPEVLAEVPSAPPLDQQLPVLGPTLGRAVPADRFTLPGVARLVGEIIPDTIEEAKHESSGPGLH